MNSNNKVVMYLPFVVLVVAALTIGMFEKDSSLFGIVYILGVLSLYVCIGIIAMMLAKKISPKKGTLMVGIVLALVLLFLSPFALQLLFVRY